jgi:hypothetical protein
MVEGILNSPVVTQATYVGGRTENYLFSMEQSCPADKLPSASSVDEPENDQKENRANGSGDDRGHDTGAKMNSQSGKQPIAYKGADDADAKIRHETKASASHDLAGKPTRDQSDQQNDKQAFTGHDVLRP